MNARNQLLWIIGLGMAAAMAVAQTPPTASRAATGTEMPAPDPTRVWNSESRADVSSIPAKIRRYAERVVKKLDRNGSGALEAVEWTSLPGDPRQIDANHDGVITVDELAAYLASYCAFASVPGRSNRLAALAAAAADDFPAGHPGRPSAGRRRGGAAGDAGGRGRVLRRRGSCGPGQVYGKRTGFGRFASGAKILRFARRASRPGCPTGSSNATRTATGSSRSTSSHPTDRPPSGGGFTNSTRTATASSRRTKCWARPRRRPRKRTPKRRMPPKRSSHLRPRSRRAVRPHNR